MWQVEGFLMAEMPTPEVLDRIVSATPEPSCRAVRQVVERFKKRARRRPSLWRTIRVLIDWDLGQGAWFLVERFGQAALNPPIPESIPSIRLARIDEIARPDPMGVHGTDRAPPPADGDFLRVAVLILGEYVGISLRHLRKSLRFTTSEHVAYWTRALARRVDYAAVPAHIRAILDGEVSQ